VSLFREPDAGKPPVRFDEREQETEPGQTGLRRRAKAQPMSHRETTATAPVLDSTPHIQVIGNWLSGYLGGWKLRRVQLPLLYFRNLTDFLEELGFQLLG